MISRTRFALAVASIIAPTQYLTLFKIVLSYASRPGIRELS